MTDINRESFARMRRSHPLDHGPAYMCGLSDEEMTLEDLRWCFRLLCAQAHKRNSQGIYP